MFSRIPESSATSFAINTDHIADELRRVNNSNGDRRFDSERFEKDGQKFNSLHLNGPERAASIIEAVSVE